MENGVGRARGRGRAKDPLEIPSKPLRRPKNLEAVEDQFSDSASVFSADGSERHSLLDENSLKIIQNLAERTKNLGLNPSALPQPETVRERPVPVERIPESESKLNINATPFFPRVERRTSTSELSDRCPSREGVATPGLELFSAEDDYHPLVKYLTEVLTCVTLYPGRFERQASKLVSVLNKRVIPDEDVLGTIVETIYSQSVIEPNFRYNGARLCSVLCNRLDAKFEKTTFRTLLLQRLQTDHKRREELSAFEPETLRGFALFLCEVYMNLEIVSQLGVKKRLFPLQKAIHETLETLIVGKDSENLRCACKCLKLAGSALEDDERFLNGGLSTQMNSLMESLKQTSTDASDVSRDVRLMILNVIELRASDWGRSPSSPVIQSDVYRARTPSLTTYYNNGDMGFNGGDHFNPYESEFYGEGGDGFEDELDFTFSSDEEFEDGMDPEMEKAFEEFMKNP